MSIFGDIVNKIVSIATGSPAAAATTPPSGEAAAPTPSAAGQPATAPNAMSEVDVENVLSGLAAQHGGGGNWQSSIVDLLKLLDLPSSLEARKELADELDVHAGPPGSAEENIALHRAVMRKLEENGGKVPDSMKN